MIADSLPDDCGCARRVQHRLLRRAHRDAQGVGQGEEEARQADDAQGEAQMPPVATIGPGASPPFSRRRKSLAVPALVPRVSLPSIFPLSLWDALHPVFDRNLDLAPISGLDLALISVPDLHSFA